MTIALIAHDNKKELMLQFCIAYKTILEKHKLCATTTTANIIREAADLHIETFLSGDQGGVQQITSNIPYDVIDMVIYFRSTLPDTKIDHDADALFHACDVYSIPFATNIATAEVLIHGLDRGLLAWREHGNPLKPNEDSI